MRARIEWTGWMLVAAVGCTAATGKVAAQQPAAVKVDASWLKSDSLKKTAEFAVIAGLTPLNAGMNFDGAKNGGLTLTVPAGWAVVLHFKNNDQVLPHSLEVIRDSEPLPIGPVPPAFAHAATSSLAAGLSTDAKQDVRFVADRPGNYLLFCAVPGHGAAGMWIRLVVSPAVKGPTLVASAPAP